MPLRLLVIDDDPAIRRSLFEMLSEEGFVVDAAETAERAMELFPDLGPDVVLTDVRMPGMNGIELLKQIRVDRCEADVIVMTAVQPSVSAMPLQETVTIFRASPPQRQPTALRSRRGSGR
jgi:DNA-binding response OmpR family regulator